MNGREDEPRSPLDEEIQVLLERLTSLEEKVPSPDEKPIRAVALRAIRERLRELSRKCTDQTCRIRTVEEVRRAVEAE